MGLADDIDGLPTYTPPSEAGPLAFRELVGDRVEFGSRLADGPSPPTEADIDAECRQVVAELGRDPDAWTVSPGTLHIRKWQQRAYGPDVPAEDQEWCWYLRATLVPLERIVAADDLVRFVRRKARRKRPAPRPGCQVWATADWQIGKRGTEGDVIADLVELPDRFEESWRRSGRPGHVVVVFGGDLVEGCQNSYPGMEFQVTLTERDQRRVTREMASRVIDRAAALAADITVIAVGGNHGEVRRSRKEIATDPSDNVDVAVVEDVAWSWRERDGIRWLLPGQDLTVVTDVAGVRVGVAHGHQFGGVGTNKVEQWWDRQAGNRRPVGSADLLISGHYHHFVCHHFGPRTFIRVPAEDAGSPWLAELAGVGARRPGSVTVDLDGEVGDVRVV